jgi:hypothetical protein
VRDHGDLSPQEQAHAMFVFLQSRFPVASVYERGSRHYRGEGLTLSGATLTSTQVGAVGDSWHERSRQRR